MKRKGKGQKILWIISFIVVLSMVGSTVLLIIESIKPPRQAQPSGWLAPTSAVDMLVERPGRAGAFCLADPMGRPV